MGNFGFYSGKKNIPAQQRAKFAEHMTKLLNLGGMMEFDEIKLYGYTVHLIKPIELRSDSEVRFHYNYFEDDGWETAFFDATKARFGAGKIGSAEFADVILAAYTLYEVYDEGPYFAIINDEIFRSSFTIGWLNNILGTNFTMKKNYELWKNAEEFILHYKGLDYGATLSMQELMNFIPQNKIIAAGGLDLTDLLYIIHGTATLTESSVKKDTYPYDILMCKRALEKYFFSEQADTVNEIWHLLQQPREQRHNPPLKELEEIAAFTMYLPARVIAYLTAELKGLLFWKEWNELTEKVYHDEESKVYSSEELNTWRQEKRNEIIPPIKTSQFLRQDSSFTFYNTPDEIIDQPNYYISDDDRLYWWDGSDEVIISEEMDEWLQDLAQQHKELKETIDEASNSNNFLERFLSLLNEITEYYERIFPFQNMFYEFLQNSYKKEYLAAVELLRIIADSEENRKHGEIIKYARNWDFTSKNVTQNPGRLKLKRYLSVMANTKLRKKYFDF